MNILNFYKHKEFFRWSLVYEHCLCICDQESKGGGTISEKYPQIKSSEILISSDDECFYQILPTISILWAWGRCPHICDQALVSRATGGRCAVSSVTIVWPRPSEPLPSPELCQWFRVAQPWHNISRDINREWGEFTEIYRDKEEYFTSLWGIDNMVKAFKVLSVSFLILCSNNFGYKLILMQRILFCFHDWVGIHNLWDLLETRNKKNWRLDAFYWQEKRFETLWNNTSELAIKIQLCF